MSQGYRPAGNHVKPETPLAERLERVQEVKDSRFGQITVLRDTHTDGLLFVKLKEAFELADHNRDVY